MFNKRRVKTNRTCPDQTTQMCTLIQTFAVCIWHKDPFTTFLITLILPMEQIDKLVLKSPNGRLPVCSLYTMFCCDQSFISDKTSD